MRFKKKVFSNLELEGQGRGIIMGVTHLLLLGPFYTIQTNFMYFFAHDCNYHNLWSHEWYDERVPVQKLFKKFPHLENQFSYIKSISCIIYSFRLQLYKRSSFLRIKTLSNDRVVTLKTPLQITCDLQRISSNSQKTRLTNFLVRKVF